MNTLRSLIIASITCCAGARAQTPCLTDFTAPPGQTAVANAAWNPATVPSTTTVSLNVNTTAGSTSGTVTGCNAVLIGMPMTGPNFPGGTTLTGCPGTFSNPATTTGSALHTFTLPPYANNYPPQNTGIPAGVNCSVCPAVFSVNMCAGQYFTYQMCVGNAYTISMCGATPSWDSYLAITTTAGTVLATGIPTFNDDGCGTTDGHASLTFIPTATGTYRVRLWEDPCTVNAAACGTIVVTCNMIPIGMTEIEEGTIVLSIQPNPANDRLLVNSTMNGAIDLTVMDQSGRVVLQQRDVHADRSTVDIAALATGSYLLHATDASGRRASRLFVKE